MEQAKSNGFPHHLMKEKNLLNTYFYLLTENYLCAVQHRQMNPEHFSDSFKILLESTWVIKS